MAHPSKHIILFDGFCVLCNSSVNWLLRHDKKSLFKFTPLQSPAGMKLGAEYGLPEKTDTVIMISPQGRVFTHSGVMLEAFKLMGGGYKLLSGLSLIPRVIRDGIYRFIANYRYRWFGKKEACVIPDPKWKDRFSE